MYKKLLKDPVIFRLSIVQFLVYFGSWFSSVAIYTMVLNFKATPTQNALVATMFYLPALLGFINGAIVDKFDLKRFMSFVLFFELFFTSLFLSVTDYSQIYLLMFFVFLRATCSFLFFASQMSLFPLITKDEEQLKAVNELHSIIWSTTFAIGMSLGGIFVKSYGVYNTIKLDIALFIIAFLVFVFIPFKVDKKDPQSIKKLIVNGFYYLKNHKTLLSLIFLHSSVALTSFDTIVNLLTDTYYKEVIAISLSIGFLNGLRAFGLMTGPFFISRLINRENLHLFLALQGAIIITWSFFEKSFYASLVFMFFIGFLTTTLWSFTFTIIQNQTQKEYLGRVVAYNDMMFMSVTIAINFFSGYLFEKGVPMELITGSLGVGFILFAFYYKSYIKP